MLEFSWLFCILIRKPHPAFVYRVIFTFLFIVFHINVSFSQSSYDEIEVSISASNSSKLYYGQPLTFLYSIKNSEDDVKYYWKKKTGINIMYTLIDIKSGAIIGNSENMWSMFAGHRNNVVNIKPPKDQSFQPYQEILTEVVFGFDISSNPIVENNKLKYFNDLGYDLLNLPVGKYRFEIEYYLLPGEEKITACHEFSVEPLPKEEEEAYKNFIVSTEYAAENKGSYSIGHKNSYENFLERFPNSVFAQYAYNNLVNKIYRFGDVPVSETQKKKIYSQYLNNNVIARPHLKARQASAAVKILKKHKDFNRKEVLELQLSGLENEDPAISNMLIELAEKDLNIKGLQSKAEKSKP